MTTDRAAIAALERRFPNSLMERPSEAPSETVAIARVGKDILADIEPDHVGRGIVAEQARPGRAHQERTFAVPIQPKVRVDAVVDHTAV